MQDRFKMSEMYHEWLSTLTEELQLMTLEALNAYYAFYLDDVKANGIRSAVEESYEAIDESQHLQVLELPEQKEVTCKKGCAHCCYLHVDVTVHEAQVILERCKDEGISIDWFRVKRQSKHKMPTF